MKPVLADLKLNLNSHKTQTDFGSLHYVAPKKAKSKEVMIFIHGFGSSWKVWAPLVKACQTQAVLKNTDFLMVDLPGFGKSENKLNHLKSADIAEELLKLAKKLGYSKVRLTGHSMGGFLALDMAARNPQILSVHIIAGTYFRLLRIANHPLKGLFRNPKLTFYYYFQTIISRSKALTWLANKIFNIAFRRRRTTVYELSSRAFIYASQNGIGYDPAKEWSTITMPVTGVFGGLDKLVSVKDMQEMRRILPAAKLTLLKDAGHSVVITHPAQTARALY